MEETWHFSYAMKMYEIYEINFHCISMFVFTDECYDKHTNSSTTISILI